MIGKEYFDIYKRVYNSSASCDRVLGPLERCEHDFLCTMSLTLVEMLKHGVNIVINYTVLRKRALGSLEGSL